eukprot:gb/GECG01016033.1/.p1 GENE.gb/GECG01016033.1/~~gb/GECG01016033.1/.p1  ORF type:complete len:126 (+),score=16.77 gb/GECG01016033.1/:1-378(+)
MFLKKALNELMVNEISPLCLGQKQIKQENTLEAIVEGYKRENQATHSFKKIEEGKANPVRKPLRIVVSVFGVQCLKRHKRRICEAYEIYNEPSSKTSEEREQNEKEYSRRQIQSLDSSFFGGLIE